MSLFEEWQDLIGNQTDESFPKFWENYSSTEKKIYSSILEHPTKKVCGSFEELVAKYDADPVIFMGFLDGIQSSLKKEQPIEKTDKSSQIELDIDLEKLYFNMLAADADYLYGLPQWETILSAEKREEITRNYKRSKTVIKEKTPGRNDLCPCGSGKKYKKCCGK
ncbi:SEC-C metal-binding domain-containing protein [Sinanaerobacter sp. ZZT-01]|uniref:SEC-C metal-binding domain-containing protein n=1 Tax=Sinanaerobacter sp. ZZT-01 TaxID=3111540 RepID=UPI002D78B7A7|nr:SEC-C metal-binding domain-containing protein [Sinanaerobacter sp. ZZT-01]WRR93465.1 SEC-C metal-binding domain-containing protein [Sinanaerobacter sp. ZZT-01]